MATLAGELRMACRQRETGFLGMIESLLFPRGRPMTAFTGRTALPLMCVIDPVAGDAGRGRVLVTLPGVTQATFNFVMRTSQRVSLLGCLGVIEFDFLPGHHVMAVAALLTQGLLVYVLLRMATDAGGRRITMFVFWLVTVVAGSALVCALERIVGQGMIEGLRCQTHDVCVAAFMVSMTIPALALSRGL